MGLDPVTLGIAASLVIGVGSAVAQNEQQRKAVGEQKKARREQEAVNAARAAQERRQQIREERIRRARIIQSSSNTGVSGSSGESGAVGGLSTQLQSNVGFNLGMQRSAGEISIFQQNAQDALDRASLIGQIGQIGQQAVSIFSMGGGSTTPTTQPASTQPANISRGGSFSPGV